MSRVTENKARECRIELAAVVDAYNESERAMGWYYYLEERLKFPFKARCKSQRAVSPLRIGEEVNVLAMAPEDECESEMLVRVRWHGRSVAVPLSQLKPLRADQMTSQAVGDWHYWLARGYQF
ncbi:MAG TPA: calcium-binding protein [Candidatus Binatia bacterium]|nr:calcium-binding protein [Candidatus Binatia bacterium]